MTVHIANFGMGNVGSIANMIRKVGGEAVVTGESVVPTWPAEKVDNGKSRLGHACFDRSDELA